MIKTTVTTTDTEVIRETNISKDTFYRMETKHSDLIKWARIGIHLSKFVDDEIIEDLKNKTKKVEK